MKILVAIQTVASKCPGHLQPGFESKLVDHKDLIETKFAPAIALVKVLQITDSKPFVTAYTSLLEARWQNADAMQQVLTLLDVTKDVAVTRLNMFRAAAAGGGGLTVSFWFPRPSSFDCLLPLPRAPVRVLFMLNCPRVILCGCDLSGSGGAEAAALETVA